MLAITGWLQSCRTVPAGPGDPVNMASYFDGAIVDVSGTWRLISDPPSQIKMTVSSTGLHWFSPGRLPYQGVVDKSFDRTIITKRNGVEREATIYGIRIDDEWWSMAVRNQDSISLGPCDADPERAVIVGSYVRVK